MFVYDFMESYGIFLFISFFMLLIFIDSVQILLLHTIQLTLFYHELLQ